MLKHTLLGAILALSPMAWAQTQLSCSEWIVSDPQTLHNPVFSAVKSVDNKSFSTKDLLSDAQVNFNKAAVSTLQWTNNDSLVTGVNDKNQLVVLTGYVQTDRYTSAQLAVNSNAIYELYVDGSKIKVQSQPSNKEVKHKLTFETGKHTVQLKMLSMDSVLNFAANLQTSGSDTLAMLNWSTDAQRNLTIHDVVDGKTIGRHAISPSGKYAIIMESEAEKGTGKRKASTRLYNLKEKKNLFVVRNDATFDIGWLPKSDKFYYTVKQQSGTDIYVYDVASAEEVLVAQGIQKMGRLSWSPSEDYVIYTSSETAQKPGDLKRIFGNDDRLPNYRNRSFLNYLDLKTGISTPISTGNLSTRLHDIKPDGTKILFSTSSPDFTNPPFYTQNLYELDLKTFELDTLWANKSYSGSCKYSPDGTQLLVSGSAEVFGDLGLKVDSGLIPNTYDKQLYTYNLSNKEASALTRDFDPSVVSAIWMNSQEICFSAMAGDRVNVYKMDLKKNAISEVPVPIDVVSSFSIADEMPLALVSGTSITTPQQMYSVNLKTGKSELLESPKGEALANVTFSATEEWNFTNASGTEIQGRVYYPAHYDASKKYPVIVYYYGGTSPTSRSFGGRYPKNIWAANGYIVYVLQPSGATGYGQNFSALHVNGWGRDAIDDIIDGTKQFLETHTSADADNVGCIGASYGGFTTMMLQTRTDIFKTAISHAGISDITSYWGEGYWGYTYSSTASRHSYPWNRKDVYVENSPLFNADKFQNSILLLHGTADTNVPVGESLQYYAALKILGKDVEMVLVDGEDHHIKDYKKRLAWHNTIVSWFDYKLKDQGNQWNALYPDKNL